MTEDQQQLQAFRELAEGHVAWKEAAVELAADGSACIRVVYTKNCYYSGEKVEFERLFDAKSLRPLTIPRMVPPGQLQRWSPRGKHGFCLRSAEEKKLLDVFSSDGYLYTLSIGDKFEKLAPAVVFGEVEWSETEERAVLVAEKKRAKPKKFSEAQDNPENVEAYLDSHRHLLSYGENLGENCGTELWVLDVPSRQLRKVLNADGEHYDPAYPVFVDEDRLIFHGIEREPLRLGQYFFTSRPHALLCLDRVVVEAGTEDPATLLPRRLAPDFFAALRPLVTAEKQVVFVGSKEKFYPHCGNLGVYSLGLEEGQNAVETLLSPEEDGFAGLPLSHGDLLASTVFLDRAASKEYFLAPYEENGRQRVFCLELGSRQRTLLPDNADESFYLLSRRNPLGLVLKRVGLKALPDLLFKPFSNFEAHTLLELETGEPSAPSEAARKLDEELKNCVFEDFELPNGSRGRLFSKGSAQPQPLIVFIHGGPHGMMIFDTQMSLERRILLSLGYALLLVNYRGSTGYGKAFAESVLGKIGGFDVEDVQDLVKKTLSSERIRIEPDRICAIGGSHSGLIVGWLAARKVIPLKCWVCINPVTYIPGTLEKSDVLDWCFSEVEGGPRDVSLPPSPEFVAACARNSPLLEAHRIEAPGLIAVGEKDLRVPPSNGIFLYKTLKWLKKPVELFAYPNDNHSLRSLEGSTHYLLNLIKFLRKNL